MRALKGMTETIAGSRRLRMLPDASHDPHATELALYLREHFSRMQLSRATRAGNCEIWATR